MFLRGSDRPREPSLSWRETIIHLVDRNSIVLGLPDEFRNMTRGLMGNYNGFETDDLAYRNGTMLAQNSSDRLIHEMGQSCKCMCMCFLRLL